MEHKKIPDTLGFLLARICKAHYSRARQMLEDIGLYPGQQFLLCTLWEGEGLTHSELANRLHVSPATITKALERMERTGFLERRADPEDQRISRVYLTKAGREIQESVEEVWTEMEHVTLRGFDEAERKTLERLLQRICENLEQE